LGHGTRALDQAVPWSLVQLASKVLDLEAVSHSGRVEDNRLGLAVDNHLDRVVDNRLGLAVDALSGQAVEPASGQAEDDQ
jgi:hypothetical protein